MARYEREFSVSGTDWLGAIAFMLLSGVSAAAAQVTERVSCGVGGIQGNGIAWSDPRARGFSSNGRFVTFVSSSSNLTSGDTNGFSDVFVFDRITGVVEIVSRSSAGVQANNDCGELSCISSDGNYVAFQSIASNLVPGDTNGVQDIFVRDRMSGTTERVSVSTQGLEATEFCSGASISFDGRFVGFSSRSPNLIAGDGNGMTDCFVHDRATGVTERVSVSGSGMEANAASQSPVLSADGRYAVFMSMASNLVPGDTNGTWDTFVHDRISGTSTRVSVDSAGVQGSGPSWIGCMSDDGRYVVFFSDAPNLVTGDVNGSEDVFVHDMSSGVTEVVSCSSSGTLSNGSSSSIYISGDGRYVAFSSNATNLVPGDSNGVFDVFVRDRLLGTTERASVANDSTQGNGASSCGAISQDGRFVLMSSVAGNLVPADTNGAQDIFVRDRFASGFSSICEPGSGSVLNCPCMNSPSGAGRGCDNSSFTGGAALAASGIAYLSLDSLSFSTSGEKPSATSVLLQGDTTLSNGLVFGQGIRCAGGTLKRLFVKTAFNGSIIAPDLSSGDPTISTRSAALGVPILPGQPYCYLVFYRDATVLGGCSALSTFNCTQSGTVSFWP